jgi:hypothetical protein
MCVVAILWTVGSDALLHAQLGVGTWVRQSGEPAGLTLIVEACCKGGRRLTYQIPGSDVTMSVESPFDGSDAPIMVGGKPSGQTMSIKRVDDLHAVAVLKMNGKTFGTSRSTLSADGKTLTVENEYTSALGGQPVGKQTETWIRK